MASPMELSITYQSRKHAQENNNCTMKKRLQEGGAVCRLSSEKVTRVARWNVNKKKDLGRTLSLKSSWSVWLLLGKPGNFWLAAFGRSSSERLKLWNNNVQ